MPDGIGRRLDSIAHAELGEDVRQVILGGSSADAELEGYLRVIEPASHQPEHLQFACRQSGAGRGGDNGLDVIAT